MWMRSCSSFLKKNAPFTDFTCCIFAAQDIHKISYLQMTRKKLEATIDGLNADIDDISAHLRTEVSPNGTSIHSDEIEA